MLAISALWLAARGSRLDRGESLGAIHMFAPRENYFFCVKWVEVSTESESADFGLEALKVHVDV